MAEVVCLGEALIDLVSLETGVGLKDARTFVRAAGGAPANVAVGLARLGVSSAFSGMVGDDAFGAFLATTLAAEGVEITDLRTTREAPTALAAVSLRADGDRDFIFYGNPAAHALLRPEHIDKSAIASAKVLHVGSISLIADPARAATLRAIDVAHEHDVLVSYDPNLRLALWPDAAAAQDGLRLGLSLAHIVKISEDEVAFLASGCDMIEGARSLWHPRLQLMAVTRGAKGCVWLNPTAEGEQPAFDMPAVDATGAGDAFMAGLLAELVRDPDALRNRRSIEAAIAFASAAGALATTQRGAIPALPDRRAINALLAGRGSCGSQGHLPT